MPYVFNEGIRIHFRTIGQGPAIVLQHGFTDSMEGWAAAGWVEPLATAFRVILIDARGHGQSDKPATPAAYAPAHRVADVLAVLDALGIRHCGFVGYSMGGWIGVNLAARAPERLWGLVAGGIHPYGQDMAPFRAGLAEGLDAWVRFLLQAGGPMLDPGAGERFKRNDAAALVAAVAEDRPPIAITAAMRALPWLLFVGDRDPLAPAVGRFAQALPAARLVKVPDANHVQAFLRTDHLVPPVLEFLRHAASQDETGQHASGSVAETDVHRLVR